MRRISVFGDSHCKFFFQPPGVYKKIGIDDRAFHVTGQPISAASVAGFRPKASTLQTKDIIRKGIVGADITCLAFGQVDLELGFYYRRAVKREQGIEPEGFVRTLLSIYREFLGTLELEGTRIALKGANLSVLKDRDFKLKYVNGIISRNKDPEAADRLAAELLSERSMNAMIRDFNRGLHALSEELGYAYFDINEAIVDPVDPDGGLDMRFCPTEFDHHLIDSLYVRRVHMRSLLAATGDAERVVAGSH